MKRQEEEILVDWKKPRAMRKREAGEMFRRLARSMPIMAGVCIIAWVALIWYFQFKMPFDTDEIGWDKILWRGIWCIITGFLAFGIFLPLALWFDSTKYTILANGMRIQSGNNLRIYAWEKIEGYFIKEGEDHAIQRLVLALKNGGQKVIPLREDIQDQVLVILREKAAEIPVKEVDAIFTKLQQLEPAGLVFVCVFSIILGCLVGKYIDNKKLVIPIIGICGLVAGPGTIWVLLRHYREIRKICIILIIVAFPYNMLGTLLMALFAAIISIGK
jgi:hypothetical protein